MLETLLLAVLIGILSSIIASILFLWFLTKIRPQLEISDQIAKERSLEGKTIYKIKVINKTSHPIINIKAQLLLVTPTVVPGGILMETKKIPLKKSEVMYIEKFDRSDEEAKYAFRFVTYEDIENIWENNKELLFRIMATHSVSGFTKVFEKKYYNKKSIKEGEFKIGEEMDIQ